jgi:hypothetical protein
MWIFRKRVYSVSKDFGSDLVEEEEKEEEEEKDNPRGQVDLEGKSIYKWYLIGFWADIDGKFDSWNSNLEYLLFWKFVHQANLLLIKLFFQNE